MELEAGRVQFNPESPISELALVGANFDRRSITVEGVDFEILLTKNHTRNLTVLESIVQPLRESLSETIGRARSLGLEYPYGTLSLVEVPTSLRFYGGGQRMGSICAQPGLLLLRESIFPLARFDTIVGNYENIRESEGEEEFGRYILEHLRGYFQKDPYGGNIVYESPKNFLSFQTGPTGPGALGIDHVTNKLVTEFLTEGSGYFSLHASVDAAAAQVAFQQAFTEIFDENSLNLEERYSNRPSVWEEISRTALSEVSTQLDPIDAYHVLLLKGGSVVKTLRAGVGDEELGRFLAELISQYSGKSYSSTEFHETAMQLGLDFPSILGDWLFETGLPGFLVSEAEITRVQDGDSGSYQYQASFFVRNDEPAPGVVTIIPNARESDSELDSYKNRSLNIGPHTSFEIAVTNRDPIDQIWIEPNLSLNRRPFLVEVPQFDQENDSESIAKPFASPSDWNPIDPKVIVVDDLDEGFSVPFNADEYMDESVPAIVRYFAPTPSLELDNGLPARGQSWLQYRWVRDIHPTSYGKYRHTYVRGMVWRTEPSSFSAQLPNSGNWLLEFHLPAVDRALYEEQDQRVFAMGPDENVSVWNLPAGIGEYEVVVEAGGQVQSVKFDAKSNAPGWIELGIFEIETSDVTVKVSGISGQNTVADAIRWSPSVQVDP